MEMQTRIANVVDKIGDDAKYDNCVKALLANKSIQAWILKCCVDEYKEFDLQQIEECIQGTPEVSAKAVHRNEGDKTEKSLLDGNQEIIGDNSEDSSVTEATITYDVRFTSLVPKTDKTVELIINVEAQKNRPNYDLRSRVVYYMSRLISGQYGTVFHKSEYDKLEKVYSIWFCVDVPNYMKNTISGIRLNEEAIYGNPQLKPDAVDLMCGIIVRLGDAKKKTDSKILNLMNTILSSEVSVGEKKRVLRDDYQIAITEELESEVAEMCNLSQSIREKSEAIGLKKGEAIGLEKGEAIGLEKGEAIGLKKGMINTIVELVTDGLLPIRDAAKKLGVSEEEFCKKYPQVRST